MTAVSLLPDRRSQLQWVALLTIAVVLPTVSLLWFMSHVVANERLAIREKLATLYRDKLAEAYRATESQFAARLADLDQGSVGTNPYPLFRRLVLERRYAGVVVWNADGSLAYPRAGDVMSSQAPPDGPLAEARQQEFVRQDYAGAAALYERFASDSDAHVAAAAILGRSRCLTRLGRRAEAIEDCQKAAFGLAEPNGDPALRQAVINARLLLLSLLTPSGDPLASREQPELLRRTAAALNGDLYQSTGEVEPLPASQNLFIAKKVLPWLSFPKEEWSILQRLVAAEELSLAAAERFSPTGPFDSVFPVDPDGEVFGLRHRTPAATVLVLLSREGIVSALAASHVAFAGMDTALAIFHGPNGAPVDAGAPEPKDKPFTTAALPAAYPGWKVALHFKGGDVFERAASRQIALYIWTGVLVIALMLITGGFAIRAVGRQIRLNKMKNDFIATVSHELKTPLASMRVLVDTLLEGHVRDEAQAKEYLRLTAKENERLSRMIDNFLTFSRMERNKNAFTMAEALPAAIARDAVEAVQTKYAANNCCFKVELAEALPEIQADHDALVTVLVNLLDNACKYTTEDKRISLAVSAEPGFVRFAVSDNGIGVARRHQRRIFDSFYQVDSSLARKAEGCGLGLSIVKFIVDAHRGKVIVESKPGQGSTFTVRVPVGRKNGDGAEKAE